MPPSHWTTCSGFISLPLLLRMEHDHRLPKHVLASGQKSLSTSLSFSLRRRCYLSLLFSQGQPCKFYRHCLGPLYNLQVPAHCLYEHSSLQNLNHLVSPWSKPPLLCFKLCAAIFEYDHRFISGYLKMSSFLSSGFSRPNQVLYLGLCILYSTAASKLTI